MEAFTLVLIQSFVFFMKVPVNKELVGFRVDTNGRKYEGFLAQNFYSEQTKEVSRLFFKLRTSWMCSPIKNRKPVVCEGSPLYEDETTTGVRTFTLCLIILISVYFLFSTNIPFMSSRGRLDFISDENH